ncbi:uncharacterized protein LOC127253380 [Andrographis paniculata]|uniref:uncharacterized protein LOC127253380 n=1 Tax=Andrographis paniculata TaxID=175694 RepID=UPI0021E9AC35|nr:uncharacterized protein LOC127253380 [Andrographis paniculata]
MKNAIRCCISCILPCGALDVIRIVHVDGHVDEIGAAAVKAAEILKLHPKHVLRRPSSSPAEGKCSGIVVDGVISPQEVLERGKIYFLIPLPEKTGRKAAPEKRKKKEPRISGVAGTGSGGVSVANLFNSYGRSLSEILSERISAVRRRGRGGVWRPRLESISETLPEG